MLNKSNIREYQLNLIKEIKLRDRVLLAVDMGLGKTISCLTAIEEMSEIKKILIVAPLRVAHNTWPDEFNNWEHLKNLTYTVIKGNEKQRLKVLEEDKRFYIINRENIPWLFQNNKINFDMVIWDESSSLKNTKLKTPKGQLTRFGAFLKLSENIKKIVLLSGTPAPNGLQDIFGQALILDKGKALGRSKNQFLENYFIDRSRDVNYKIWEAKKNSYEEVMNKINHLMIKMKSEDYIKLPDFLSINHYVTMTDKELNIYKKLKEDFLLKDDEIIATNPAVLINKLLQFSTGSVYKEDKTYKTFHTLKIEALKELIDENENENFLIFYNYKHEKEQLEKAFKNIRFFKEGKDLLLPGWGENKIKDWNDGKIKIMACHPASAGHGLNLQHGGSIMVWLSLPWSLELYQQSNKRLHRSGQLNNVKCYHMLTKDTLDEHVLKVLKSKDAKQEHIFNLINRLSD